MKSCYSLQTNLLPHSRVDHDIAAFNALRTTLEAFVYALGHYHLDFFPFLRLHAPLHELLDLFCLLPLRHIGRFVNALRLLHRSLELLGGFELLARLCLCDLLDRPRVEGTHLGAEGGDSLLGDWDIGLVMLLFIVQEPGRKAVLSVKRVAIEAVVDELGLGLLPIDQLLCERYRFGSNQAVFCPVGEESEDNER